MSSDLVIGVDGGQSSTRTLLADTDGSLLGSRRTGPANHIHEPGGLERQFRALREGYEGAFKSAGMAPREVACAYLGLTGSGDLATASRAIPARRVVIRGDVHTAFAGALPDLVGVVVISGTGSIAYGRDRGGREHRSGGWGYFAGDEGSGYDIARHAFRAVFQAADGRSPETGLTELLLGHYGCGDLKALHRRVYSGDLGRDRLASAAALVAHAARQGDEPARRILEGAARDLAALVTNTMAHLDFGDDSIPFATVGGVFASGPLIHEPLLRFVRSVKPEARLQEPFLPPGHGALVLALQELGIAAAGPVLDNLRRSAAATH